MYIWEEEEDSGVIDPREQAFHNMIREHLIFFILLIILYGSSFAIISAYRRRREELFIDDEDGLVYRISLWMCTFSLAVSIGTALLLPFSIVTNEVLILYPDSYYIQWLNDSLIQSLWSYVFVFSNISLFILLPFAYFFTESEGFSGSKKGIMARVYETFVLLLILSILVLGMTYLICSFFGYNHINFSNLLLIWQYLPFLYSCISFFGVLLLLVCTPLGIVNLFTVLGEVITKPHILRNTQDEYEEIKFEEISLRRKIENIRSMLSPSGLKSKSMPSLSSLNDSFNHNNRTSVYNGQSAYQSFYKQNASHVSNSPTMDEMEKNLSDINSSRVALEKKLKVSWIRRNLGYPLAMLALMCLTAVSALNVVQNTLELLVGIKALPLSTAQHFVLGIASLSKMGPVGAAVEIILILYLWCASVVGLYKIPLIGRIRPKLHDTLFTQVIANCAVVLVLSSALPLLSRTVGITNFDLLGNFGRIEWLGNFYVVLFYNCVFAITAALCLTTKIVTAVSRELLKRFKEFSDYMREQFNYFSAKTTINMNGSQLHRLYHNKQE